MIRTTSGTIRAFNASRKFITAAFLAAAITGVSATASAAVDGHYNPGEYTNVTQIFFRLDNGNTVPDPGTLAWRVDASGNVFVAFVQPLSINDNTYGANSIGWTDKKGNPSTHSFGNLTGSDRAHFDFTNAAGQAVLSFDLDYITKSSLGSSGFASLGVTGGDGRVDRGNAAWVVQWGTSLDYNLNNIAGRGTNNNAPGLGYSQYTVDSPAATPHRRADGSIDYSRPYMNSAAPGWDYNITYEVMISAAAFGPSGFGSVTVPFAHNSPSKFGQNTIPVCPPSDPTCIPEPSTYMAGFGICALLLGVHARQVMKRKKAMADQV
jgi:hypothetical protein